MWFDSIGGNWSRGTLEVWSVPITNLDQLTTGHDLRRELPAPGHGFANNTALVSTDGAGGVTASRTLGGILARVCTVCTEIATGSG